MYIGNNAISYNTTLATGTWHYVAMTYDGTNLRGYLDGSLVAGPTAESGSGVGTCGDPNYTSVGAIHSGSYMQFMDGEIDESSVWSRALSASEISQLYNSGSGVQYPFSPAITEGSGQTELWQTQAYGGGSAWWAGATKPAVAAGSQTMSFNYNTANGACDEVMAALKAASTTQGIATTTVYTYGQTGYANPDAVTSISDGVSTTTYAYDANGNLVQKSVGGTVTTYLWDYLNRLLAVGSGGATTTFGYDASGARVFQSTATTRPFTRLGGSP